MKFSVVVTVLLAALPSRADEDADVTGLGATPVQKVLDLLASMKAKGEEEKQKEALQYAKYEQFCANTQEEKEKSIKDTASQMEILTADISKMGSDISDMEAALPELNKDIDKWTADKDKAAAGRQEERAAYMKAHGEYLKAIQNVGKAYTTLKAKDVDKEQAKSFLQLPDLFGDEDVADDRAQADVLASPTGARAAIQAFLAENSEVTVAEQGPGEAKGYEFGSDKILDLLKKLEGKFKKERTTLEHEETEKKHSYELLIQTWKSQISGAEKTRDDKVAAKLKKEQTKAEKEKDLTDLKKLDKDDKKYLEDLKTTCTQKAADFKERQGLRQEELVAIVKAADAIRGTVLKVTEKKAKKGTSLAALRSDIGGAVRERAIALLRQRAEELDSNTLSSLALRVEGDGLTKVRKMIAGMVSRLQEEAAADTEKDAWCKKELATNEQARTSKGEQVNTLQGEVNQLEVDITELGDNLDALAKDIAKLAADREESTKLREAEKAENEETIKDAQAAQKAIAQAVAALDSFYSGAAAKAKTSLLQEQDYVPDAPEIFDGGSYTGMENGGVTALLEILESDFARMETETKAEEAQGLGEYTKFMSDSKVDKAAKEKELELKTASKTQKANGLKAKKIDLQDAKKALAAANKYLEELKPECLKPAMTKEEKMEQRKQEIESLKEVLEVLQG
mmetsp:Transcript_7880/g.18251  ORF Transcript_7880/g.18251 Transcript_7880/m.18251 type:complete len:683 (+) Transcript_7880:52-2100(+)